MSFLRRRRIRRSWPNSTIWRTKTVILPIPSRPTCRWTRFPDVKVTHRPATKTRLRAPWATPDNRVHVRTRNQVHPRGGETGLSGRPVRPGRRPLCVGLYRHYREPGLRAGPDPVTLLEHHGRDRPGA